MEPAKSLMHSPLRGKLGHLAERIEGKKGLHGLQPSAFSPPVRTKESNSSVAFPLRKATLRDSPFVLSRSEML
jgi:hypothetical protein